MAAVAAAPEAPHETSSGEVEDRLLVARVRRGDDVAFERLYERYRRRITAYVNGMVHDHGRAEDITQEVFVSALRRMRDTDRPIAFKPWIYEIAKNACIDQFRRSRRTEEVSYDADGGLGSADYGRLVSTAAMPEATVESRQQLDDLCGAFGGLSEAHHQILVMRELEGLSYREIGERLGMSRPSVESTLFRARRRLTEEYEELVSGARCQRIGAIIASSAEAALGARDQRRLARHVSHCQPCRRQARIAGLHVAVTEGRPLTQKIAAFLPLPLFLRRRWIGGGSPGSDAAVLGHASTVAQWSAQLGAVVDPSWMKAAAAAATVAVAGAGAGVAARQTAPVVRGGDVGALVAGVTDRRGAVDDGASTLVAAALRAPAASATGAASPVSDAPGAGRPETAPAQGVARAPSTGPAVSAPAAAAPSLDIARTLLPAPPPAAPAGRPVSGGPAPAAPVVPKGASLGVAAPQLGTVVAPVSGAATGAAGKATDAVGAVTGSAGTAAGQATGAAGQATGDAAKKLGVALGGG